MSQLNPEVVLRLGAQGTMKTAYGKSRSVMTCIVFAMLAMVGYSSEPNPAFAQSSHSTSATSPAYPVKVSANGRYLVDQNNTPFLIVGDTPQGLISRLNEKEIDDFFADRQAHGFNTMGWVDVLCGGRDFITNIYATTPDGIRPFT